MSEPVRVSVVIPAFDEEQGIGAVLAALRAECGDPVNETLVVDDGSRDGTAGVAVSAGARVLANGANRGYDGSLKRGILEAAGEIVVTMDADGQRRAADLRRLVEAAAEADMVVGQRTRLLHSPLWRMPGKWLVTAMASYLCGREIPDLNRGLRAMRRDVVRRYLHVRPAGFSFSTTLTMAMLTRGQRVAFVPIEVEDRRHQPRPAAHRPGDDHPGAAAGGAFQPAAAVRPGERRLRRPPRCASARSIPAYWYSIAKRKTARTPGSWPGRGSARSSQARSSAARSCRVRRRAACVRASAASAPISRSVRPGEHMSRATGPSRRPASLRPASCSTSPCAAPSPSASAPQTAPRACLPRSRPSWARCPPSSSPGTTACAPWSPETSRFDAHAPAG